MPTIELETYLAAPIERCFDFARDLAAHVQSAHATGERIVSTTADSLLALGDIVTFEARHFGIRQRLTARITEFSRPHRFVDEMMRGAFTSLQHVHEFRQVGTAVVMTDRLTWVSPLGLLGQVADTLLVKRHLLRFMRRKQDLLKALIEAPLHGPLSHPEKCGSRVHIDRSDRQS